MSSVRIWLDEQKIQPAEFKTAVDAEGLTCTIGFLSVEEADRFRAQFDV